MPKVSCGFVVTAGMDTKKANQLIDQAGAVAEATLAEHGLDEHTKEGGDLYLKVMIDHLAAHAGVLTLADLLELANGRAGAYEAPPLQ